MIFTKNLIFNFFLIFFSYIQFFNVITVPKTLKGSRNIQAFTVIQKVLFNVSPHVWKISKPS